jgi:hypothetical protein
MRTLIFLLSLTLFISFSSCLFSQNETDTTNITTEDTLQTAGDTVQIFITGLIQEVNRRSELIDGIMSQGEITVKTKTIDNSGSIDIKAKKKNDVWFNITGPLGINIAEAHFERKKFVFYNARSDEVITGSSSVHNIGTLAKVRCTFDDLLNAFSGTVRIPKGKTDVLSLTEEPAHYVVQLVRGTITRRYWVDKSNFSVFKYAYYGKSGSTLIQFEFSNFTNVGDATYAKKVEIRRPKQGEYFALKIETYSHGYNDLNFRVHYPSDVVHKNWH